MNCAETDVWFSVAELYFYKILFGHLKPKQQSRIVKVDGPFAIYECGYSNGSNNTNSLEFISEQCRMKEAQKFAMVEQQQQQEQQQIVWHDTHLILNNISMINPNGGVECIVLCVLNNDDDEAMDGEKSEQMKVELSPYFLNALTPASHNCDAANTRKTYTKHREANSMTTNFMLLLLVY